MHILIHSVLLVLFPMCVWTEQGAVTSSVLFICGTKAVTANQDLDISPQDQDQDSNLKDWDHDHNSEKYCLKTRQFYKTSHFWCCYATLVLTVKFWSCLCIVQGAEIISQTSRVEAEDKASSDDDKSLPEDSDNDSDAVSCPVPFTLSVVISSFLKLVT